MNKGKIIVISGPSGSGKTTLHNKLLLSRRLKRKLVKSVSITTRTRRSGERSGRDYLFVTKKQFFYKRKTGQLLEWKKVFDNYYGTPKRKVERLLKSGKNVLLCIDVEGAKVVRCIYPATIGVFIATPSWSELKNRLKKRASETKKDLQLRLKTARKELLESKNYNYVVVNDNLTKALRKLENIIFLELKIKNK